MTTEADAAALAEALDLNRALYNGRGNWCTWCGASSKDQDRFALGKEVRGRRPLLCAPCAESQQAGDHPRRTSRGRPVKLWSESYGGHGYKRAIEHCVALWGDVLRAKAAAGTPVSIVGGKAAAKAGATTKSKQSAPDVDDYEVPVSAKDWTDVPGKVLGRIPDKGPPRALQVQGKNGPEVWVEVDNGNYYDDYSTFMGDPQKLTHLKKNPNDPKERIVVDHVTNREAMIFLKHSGRPHHAWVRVQPVRGGVNSNHGHRAGQEGMHWQRIAQSTSDADIAKFRANTSTKDHQEIAERVEKVRAEQQTAYKSSFAAQHAGARASLARAYSAPVGYADPADVMKMNNEKIGTFKDAFSGLNQSPEPTE